MEYNSKVLVVDSIHEKLLRFLNKNYEVTIEHPVTREKLQNIIKDYDVLVLRSGAQVDKKLLEQGSRLHTIIRAGTGTDNIDLKAVSERGINFYNTPSTNSRAVAELSFGLMHCLSRHIRRASNEIEKNIWNKKSLLGFELTQKKLGLVGFGSIGKEIADIAKGYRMDIHCTVSQYSTERAAQLAKEKITLHVDLHNMLRLCDIVVICCPYTEQTQQLIDAAALSCLSTGSILVNVARGGVIDEEQLWLALKEKRLYAAASDVFINERAPSPLFSLANFIGTPHIGAMSNESQQKIADLIIHYLQEQEKSIAGVRKQTSTLRPIFN
ncbi:NAD(P)-dependent oxidoreductase [Erwinia piriflorinigrans]|uniref:D-3-phosphoglycerate dehydrogenase n=1 Tax=Erwinia piriflorinigrans CFBP 5888 TaxID=1161919 RepID=V5ZAW4_9GAMM|nr:NAD(P)-dependent oxidoreductase [Erwinia piriflorinigrans]CCG88051.1 D-3-phosphoglycerate dehydrogenase [Erwinia piriflorinigrans CFBP 5888]